MLAIPSGIWYMSDSLASTGVRKRRQLRSMIYLILALDLSFFILLYFLADTLWVLFLLVISAIASFIFYIQSRIERSRQLSFIGSATSYTFNVDIGLRDREIATLPTYDYKRPETNNCSGRGESDGPDGNRCMQCVICLGILQTGEMVRQIPACKHLFHVECVDKWLRLHSTCPMCRSKVVPPPAILPPV